MTTHLDSSIRILGFPVSKLKALLTSWERTDKVVGELAGLADVSVSPGAAAALMGEAWRLGLIDFVNADGPLGIPTRRVGLTDAGLAFVSSKFSARTPKAKATKVLDSILDRAQALMDDDEAPIKPNQIWVFGSYVKPEKDDVGDLDIVVTRKDTGLVELAKMQNYVDQKYPGLLPDSLDRRQWRAGWYFLNRMVYGERKNPLVAPNDIFTLIDMHEPCALYFDAARGGRIEPEFHDHHPDSNGRGAGIRDPLVMPALDASDRFELSNPICVDGAFSEGMRESAFYAMDHTATDYGDSFGLRWSANPDDSIGIRRVLEWGDGRWYCDVVIDGCSRANASPYSWNSFAQRIVWLAQADMLRLAAHRHAFEAMHDIQVTVSLDNSYGDDHPLRSALADEIRRAASRLSDGKRPALPAEMAFGASFLFDGNTLGLRSLRDFTSREWSDNAFLFDRETFEAWEADQRLKEPRQAP